MTITDLEPSENVLKGSFLYIHSRGSPTLVVATSSPLPLGEETGTQNSKSPRCGIS